MGRGFRVPVAQKGQPGGGAKAAQAGKSHALTWPCPARLLTLGDTWDIPAPLVPQFWNGGELWTRQDSCLF